MEITIFDFGVSYSELNQLEIFEGREVYAKERSQMEKMYHLQKLMKLRGDDSHTKKILQKIYEIVYCANMG